jgi:hypothetical protein
VQTKSAQVSSHIKWRTAQYVFFWKNISQHLAKEGYLI